MNSKITSKKALEAYHRMANGNSIIIDDTKAYETIKQDLDKLEKLENDYKKLKERYKHRAETSNDLCKAVKQYENVIEFLVEGFHFEVKELTTLNGESEYYLYWQDKFSSYGVPISKEKYELLKETL